MSIGGSQAGIVPTLIQPQRAETHKHPLLDFFYRQIPLLAIHEQFASTPEMHTSVYLGLLIYWIQQLAFVLNPNYGMYWGYILGKVVSTIAYCFHIPLWDVELISGAALSTSHGLIWTLVVICLLIMTLVLYYKLAVDGADRHPPLFVAAQRIGFRSIAGFLLIPSLHALLSVMVCDGNNHLWIYNRAQICWETPHLVLFVVAVLVLIIIIPVTFIFGTCDFIDAPLHQHLKARSHATCDHYYYAMTVTSVVLYHVLMAYHQPITFAAIFAALQFMYAMSICFHKPYYNEDVGSLHAAMHLSTSWVAVMAAITVANPGTFVKSNLGSVVTLGGFPMVCLMAVVLQELRVSSVFRRALWLTAQAVHGRLTARQSEAAAIGAFGEDMDVSELPVANGLAHDRWTYLKDIAIILTREEALGEGLDDGESQPGASRSQNNKAPAVPGMIAPFVNTVYSPLDCELVTRFVAHFSRRFNVSPTTRMVAYAAKTYTRGFVTFPDDLAPRIHFANFLWQFHPSMVQTGLDELKAVASNHQVGSSLSTAYHGYGMQGKLRFALGVRSKNHTLLFNMTESLHMHTLSTISSFWFKLTETSVDLKELSDLASRVTKYRDETISSFRRTIQNQSSNDIGVISRLGAFLDDVLMDHEGAAVCRAEVRDITDCRAAKAKGGARKAIALEIDPTTLSNRLLQTLSEAGGVTSDDGSQGRRGANVLIGQTFLIALFLLALLSMILGVSSARANESKTTVKQMSDGGALRYLALRFTGSLYAWELEQSNQTKQDEHLNELSDISDAYAVRFAQIAHGEAKTTNVDHNLFFTTKAFLAHTFDGTPTQVSAWDLAESINAAQKNIVRTREQFGSESESLKLNAPVFAKAFNQSAELYVESVKQQAYNDIRDNVILFSLIFICVALMYRTIVINFRWIAQSRVFVFQLFTLIPYDDVEGLASDAKQKVNVILTERRQREEKERRKSDPLNGDDENLVSTPAEGDSQAESTKGQLANALINVVNASGSEVADEMRKISVANSVSESVGGGRGKLPKWMLGVGYTAESVFQPYANNGANKAATAAAGGGDKPASGDVPPPPIEIQTGAAALLILRSCVKKALGPKERKEAAAAAAAGEKKKVTVTNTVYIVAADDEEDDEPGKAAEKRNTDAEIEDLDDDGAEADKKRNGRRRSETADDRTPLIFFFILLAMVGVSIGLLGISIFTEDEETFSTTVDNEQLDLIQDLKVATVSLDTAALRAIFEPSADTFAAVLSFMRKAVFEEVLHTLSQSRSEETAALNLQFLVTIEDVRHHALDLLLLTSEGHPDLVGATAITEISKWSASNPPDGIIALHEAVLPTNYATTMSTSEVSDYIAKYIALTIMSDEISSLKVVLQQMTDLIASRTTDHTATPVTLYVLSSLLIFFTLVSLPLWIAKRTSLERLYSPVLLLGVLLLLTCGVVMLVLTSEYSSIRSKVLHEKLEFDAHSENARLAEELLPEISLDMKSFVGSGKVSYWYDAQKHYSELIYDTFALVGIDTLAPSLATQLQKMDSFHTIAAALTMRVINGSTLIEDIMQETFDTTYWEFNTEEDHEEEVSKFGDLPYLYSDTASDLANNLSHINSIALATVMNTRYTSHLDSAISELHAAAVISKATEQEQLIIDKESQSNIRIALIIASVVTSLVAFVIAVQLVEPFGELTSGGGSMGSTSSVASNAAENMSTHLTLLSRARVTLLVLGVFGAASLTFGILLSITAYPLFVSMNTASEREYALAATYFHTQELLASTLSANYYSSDPDVWITKSTEELERITARLYMGSSLGDGKLAALGQNADFDYILFAGNDWRYRQQITNEYAETQVSSSTTIPTTTVIQPGPFGTSVIPLSELARLWSTLATQVVGASEALSEETNTQMSELSVTMFDSFEYSNEVYGNYILSTLSTMRSVFDALTVIMIVGLVVAAVFVFLPMVLALVNDEASIWSLISMIPLNVRDKVPAIADYIETGRADSAAELQRKVDISENLLKNILPTKIANRLKSGEQPIADMHSSVTLCFTDLVGFTAVSSQMNADEIVSFLNELFVEFDTIAELFELEKIKTIGDAYFMAGGLDPTVPHHALRVVEASLCFFESLEEHNDRHPDRKALRMRLGVHTGSAVAGVIGTKKVAYDLWGSSVEIANTMESSGVPGRVHVSESSARSVHEFFACDPRGPLPPEKGMPEWMPATFLITGRTNASPYQHVRRPKMAKHMLISGMDGVANLGGKSDKK